MPKKRKSRSVFLWYGVGFALIVLLASLLYLRLVPHFSPPCANSMSCEESLTLKIDNDSGAIFQNQPIEAPDIDLSQEEQSEQVVLGEEDSGKEKHIYVNLTTQTLQAYEGDELFMEAPVSTGLWGWTPVGEFRIWIKIRSTTMSGGSGADYYYLPNVPYTMFFSNKDVPASRGYGIHGAYWHNNFGHPMSHGCINMREVDVKKLYEWATPESEGHSTHSTKDNPGTKITIFEEEETM